MWTGVYLCGRVCTSMDECVLLWTSVFFCGPVFFSVDQCVLMRMRCICVDVEIQGFEITTTTGTITQYVSPFYYYYFEKGITTTIHCYFFVIFYHYRRWLGDPVQWYSGGWRMCSRSATAYRDCPFTVRGRYYLL